MKGGTGKTAILSNESTVTYPISNDSRAISLSVLIYSILLYAGSLLWTGCGIYWSNHALQLPLVFELNDPSLYPNDPFVGTLQYYVAPVWKAVAVLNRQFPIEPLLIALFLCERLLLLLASARLALSFAPGSKVAAVAAMAFIAIAPSPILGNGTIVTDYFEHTGLSIAFCLLAFGSFFRSRPFWTAIWLSIAFHLNSLYGCYAITYIFAGLAADIEPRVSKKVWFFALLLFLVLISPTLIVTIGAVRQSSTNTQLWLQIARLRFPHHLFPFTWSAFRYLLFALLFSTIVLVSSRAAGRRLRRFVFAWSLVCLVWLAFSFFAAYVMPRPVLLIAHPVRGTDLWYAIGGIAVIVSVVTKINSQRISSLLAPLLVITIVALGLFSAVSRPGFLKFPDKELRDVAAWAERSTPGSSTFLVNPLNGEFRALSRRPLFFSWKDGSAILWDRPFVSVWTERLKALGFDFSAKLQDRVEAETAVENLYASLTDNTLQELSSRYNIQYAVTAVEHVTNYPVVYRNSSLKVLLLKTNSEK